MQKLLTKNEKKYVSDLIYYTIDEIKNFKNGNVIVVKDKKDILFFVDEAKFNSNNKKLYFVKIGSKLSNKINKQIKINLNNYNLSLKNMSVRHILNHHSNSSEVLRGQIPIKKTNFFCISKIITKYDKVEIVGFTMQNKPIIKFIKKIKNEYHLICYVSDKRHTLEVKTLYKKRAISPCPMQNP